MSTPSARMTLDVHVPSDAKVWFQGNLMDPTGSLRRFYSPPLRDGVEYLYEVQGMWSRRGEIVNVSRTLRVKAGEHLDVDLEAPAPATSTSTMRTRELPMPADRK
jgi:uncharacterized protein (TIGR03000 family)